MGTTTEDRSGTTSIDVSTWPLDGEHLDLAAGWLAEERNARWLDFGAGTEVLTPLSLKVMSQRPQHRVWVYGPPEDRTPVGLVALGNIQPRFKTAEAWCVLGDKDYGSRDLTVRAVARLLEHAFGELELGCVYAWTVEVNRGGRRLLDRLGFRFAGSLRASHRIGDRVYDRLWFDLLPDEFQGYGDTW